MEHTVVYQDLHLHRIKTRNYVYFSRLNLYESFARKYLSKMAVDLLLFFVTIKIVIFQTIIIKLLYINFLEKNL